MQQPVAATRRSDLSHRVSRPLTRQATLTKLYKRLSCSMKMWNSQRPAVKSWNRCPRYLERFRVSKKPVFRVPESETSTRLPDSGFDPAATILAEACPVAQSNGSQTLESSETLLPSIFEETESFCPKVVDIIAERINDSCSKEPLDTKLKELQDKYKNPENFKVS